jgi:hypothetical protein
MLASCDNGGGGEPTETPAVRTAAAAPTASFTAVVPPKPSSLADYPTAIAAYATANPAAANDCIEPLFTAWDMPVSPAEGCRTANTDDDAEAELVVVASADADGIASYMVLVLDPVQDGFDVAFESTPYPAAAGEPLAPVLGAGDLNGDRVGELAYTSQLCAEGRCFDLAFVLQGTGGAYVELTPAGGVGVIDGSFELEDADGDGAQELLASGTRASTPEAGPQRLVVETWAWDGAAYALSGTAPGASNYLYHRVLDADALLAAGDYAGSEAAYVAAVDDQSLLLWKADENERAELDAYALFRAALAHLLSGGDATTANGYLDRAKAFPNTLHAQLAASFQAAYAAKGEVGTGCAAANEDVRFNEAEYRTFWDYGTDNAGFDPAAVCPF